MLTIDDLVQFCEKQNFSKFSSKESGYQICVQVPAKFEKIESNDEDILIAPVLAFHTSNNRNKSSVPESAARKAMKEMAYKPVLANFCEIDGVRDFTSHDFEIDEDGNYTYYEKQVGCFTTDKPYMEQDPKNEDRMNVFAKVAIPRHYTDAADIIERKGGTNCSVELAVNELSWDSREKVLILEDITVMALTLLGKDPETGEDIQPGMENAHVQIEDFSAENNSVVNKSELINEITTAVLERLNSNKNKQADFAEENTAERRKTNVVDENVNIEFEETEASEEEVKVTENEEVEGVVATEEEETPVAEMEETSEEEIKEEESEDTDTPEVVEEFDDDPVEDDSEDDSDEVDNTDDGVLNNGQQGKKAFNVNGMTFEVSMSEVINSLFELVNNSYSESDNDYYSVEVYEASKTVVMIGWFSGRAYRQSYKVRNDVYSLVGDRVSVKAVYVTADEEAELDKIRSNYSVISDKLAKYEAEPEKMEILNSSDYANIADQSDFVELKKRENHFDLTVNELKDKADAMLLQYAKSGKLNFAASESEKKEEPKKDFFAFAVREEKSSFLDGLLKRR